MIEVIMIKISCILIYIIYIVYINIQHIYIYMYVSWMLLEVTPYDLKNRR